MISTLELEEYLRDAADLRVALGIPVGVELPLTPIGQGEYNANFKFTHPVSGQHLVLRVNMGSQMHLDDQIGYEFKALQLLEHSGRTPHAYYVDGSRSRLPYGVLVMEFLPGRPLVYETGIVLAAEILADVHSVPVPAECHLVRPEDLPDAIVQESRDMLAVYTDSPFATPHISAALEQLAKKAGRLAHMATGHGIPETERHVVNTELNAANFLVNGPARPNYLVDWEKPILGDVAQDIAHFLAPTTTLWKTETVLTREQMAEFLGLYCTAVNGRFSTHALESRFEQYLSITCLRGIAWCAMAYVEYQDPRRTLRNEYTYEKIKAYLAPEFLDCIDTEFFG
ncbi:MAG: aminoglycoside phosphotransferase family protein [Coriobacteriia bacterium]|nr:aminoglycoside phosphotransferase family protein [Coriobacteriia bacterium]